MADAKTKTPEQIGADKPSAAAQVPALTDDQKAKVAERFVWKPGDVTITNPDGTIVK